MAIRTFSDCVQDSSHAFNRHPTDYTLFQIGEFDDNTGIITTHETKLILGNGLDFINEDNVVSMQKEN